MKEFHLQNEAGLRLSVLDFGATLTNLAVPVDGRYRNVLLACEPLDYPRQSVYLGAMVGRFANRIGNARLARAGQEWQLDANEGPTCLHGGRHSLHNRIWDVEEQTEDHIRLRTLLADGEQGFPGNLAVELVYRLEGFDLVIEICATTDAPTPVNLTSHAYFNLDGGDVREHRITLAADHYLPIDERSLPLNRAGVEGVFDLRHGHRIGNQWLTHPQQMRAHGFDHCFLLDTTEDKPAVTLVAGDERLMLEMYTDQPGVQLYTGNWLAGTPALGGGEWHNHQGLCLEAQQLPDSPNRPELGDPWLLPGETYRHLTRYRLIPSA
ncbi:aldose epimerase family protein [Aeromonas rivipollensis]|uniref:Aldose 1-epimerase n=1 Tax=Aeromonas rivipollensis TaxID=948519 RepID=A0AAW9YG23_9GAMM|nr:aldose epimerase family protein [Aeromonas rivipollensis]NEX77145.1 galactose mutarotase [Aeromonas rivipollensis]